MRVHRLNNKWIIVKGERSGSFEQCWTGRQWSSRVSSAKKFATRLEAQAEIDRNNQRTRG
jgi:hypothetical protein